MPAAGVLYCPCIVFLIGALHGPGKVGTRVYAVVSLIPGLTGMGLGDPATPTCNTTRRSM